MSAEELARPGVEVIQQFRTVTPSVITPTLVPTIVGVAKQLVEVQEVSASGGVQLNTDALVTLPALFIAAAGVGDPLRYSGLHGLSLAFSVNEGPDAIVVFSDPTAFGLSPATIVDQVNTALAQQDITAAIAETVGDDTWQLRTLGVGPFQSIRIAASTSPAVASAFGAGIERTFTGLTAYNQFAVLVPPTALPDPAGNLEELVVDPASVRAFLATGSGGLQEALRDTAFLQRGEVSISGSTTEGTVDLSTDFPFFSGQVLWLRTEIGEVQVVTIPSNVNTAAQLLALLNGTSGFTGLTASLGGSNGLVFSRDEGTYESYVQILAPDTNSANTLLGLTPQVARGTGIRTVDDGNGDAVTPLLQFSGVNFTASAGSATLTGSGAPNLPPAAGSTLVLSDGGQPQTIVFDGTETTLALVKAAIEAVMGSGAGGVVSVDDSGPNFLATNTRIGEESFLEVLGGTALGVLDTGDTPAETVEGTQSLNADIAASTTEGTVNLADGSGFPTLGTQTFQVSVDGAAADTVTLGSEANFAALKATIEGDVVGGGGVVATRASGTTGGLVLTSVATGSSSSIQIIEGTGGAALLGLAIETVQGEDVFPTIGTETFQVSINQGAPLTVTMSSETAFGAVKTTIEGDLAGVTATQGVNGGLVLTGTDTGGAASLEVIDDGGGGVALFGLTVGEVSGSGETLVTGAMAFGAPFQPAPGDQLYVDGLYYADIAKVAPGGATDTLRVNRLVPIADGVGRHFYIVAKRLVPGSASLGVSRPRPDLTLDGANNLVLKHNQLRDTRGFPITGVAPLYVSYTAVRQDVSPLASNPGLLRFSDSVGLASALSPINTDNPLGFGLFCALVNAPGIEITGLGVDAVSADSPYGTVEAFTRAAEYLESFEVYAIAPLTHDPVVAQVFNTHVSFMSEPASKSERIVLWNPEEPVRALDTLVASGTDGDGLTATTFDTKVVSLSTLLNNAGVPAVGTIPVSKGVFLDIAGDDKSYSVQSVVGGVVTIRTTFAAAENADGFFSTTPLTLPIISQAFAIRVRGGELLTPVGTKDKAKVAATMAALGQSFQNRRFWLTFPATAGAIVDGLEQRVEGFYLNAAVAGMIGQQPPQQSFTNFPMAGFTRVFGSNDTFSDRQLNQMAAGGVYVIVQDAPNGPLTARMALTTDLSSIETRTDSITKVVDFSAKFLRRGLRNFIGRFNITQGFLDTLGTVGEGLGSFLVESGVLIGLTFNNIIQDEDARDSVLVDTTLDPPYPCNYVRLTLVV